MTLGTLLITVLLSAALIRIYRLLCRRLPVQPVAPKAAGDDDAYLAMFSVAHDDIWWAKEHAWTIVTAALAILIAVLLVDFSNKDASLKHFLSATLFLVAGASNWYVGRMQSDMAIARVRSAFLIQRCPQLARVVTEVIAGDLSDYNRGSSFMVALLILTSAVGGISLSVLESAPRAALAAYLVLLVWGLAGLFFQVKLRASREKAFTLRAA
jgi:hypothetical protein